MAEEYADYSKQKNNKRARLNSGCIIKNDSETSNNSNENTNES